MVLSLSSLEQNIATLSPMLFFGPLSSLSVNTSFERAETPERRVDFCRRALNWRGHFKNKVFSNFSSFSSLLPSSFFFNLDCDNCQCHFASSQRVTDTFKVSPCDMLVDADDSLFSLTGAFKRSSSILFESALLLSWLPLMEHTWYAMRYRSLKASSLAFALKLSFAKWLQPLFTHLGWITKAQERFIMLTYHTAAGAGILAH